MIKRQSKELQEKWNVHKIPLEILIENRRIKILHKFPSHKGDLAQLRLSPSLAYLLGYTRNFTNTGQYLRFDEENEFHAPNEPKLFIDHCHNKDRENLFRTINTDLESKWQFYAETKIAEMKKKIELENTAKLHQMELEFQEKLEKQFAKHLSDKKLELEDCRDREKNDITPFNDFDLISTQYWTLKGVVQNGQLTNMGFDEDTQKQMFSLQLKDHSGTLNITAFGKNALVLAGIAVTGAKYYISNTNDKSDITAFINNHTYKISFETVK